MGQQDATAADFRPPVLRAEIQARSCKILAILEKILDKILDTHK